MITTPLFLELENLRHKWGWLMALGILMIVLGIVALVIMPAATIGTVLVLGWLLVISGVIEAVQAFRVRQWGGLFLHLIGGVLGILVGLLVVTHPVAGALAWTLLFASFFTVIGVFRLVAAIRLKFPNWGWAAFDGAITLGLGILLWIEWPWSGLWFMGLAVGISLMLRGWSYVMFALAIHSLPIPTQIRQAA
ncbi:MAG: HdeD family acid-resistance protein [Candidatus Angelobacter sp.]